MNKKIDINNFEININYFYAITLTIVGILCISIVYDILQIHIYRQDALYYVSSNVYYTDKVASEGRWINYIFFDLFSNINGRLLSIFIIGAFGYFIFFTAVKWTQNKYYSIILAFLCMQIPSFYALIGWPAVIAPALFVLLLSIYVYTKNINIFIFFILFGILFFGTQSNFYYLLPLLFLGYLTRHDYKQNIRFIFLKLLPAWAIGFIIGYVVAQLIVYINFNHFIDVADWRNPQYINSLHDLSANTIQSILFLREHIKYIFVNNWFFLLLVLSVIIANVNRRKDLIFLPLIIFLLMIIIHYIIVMPIGIHISPRTVIATWVGIFAIMFFIPNIKKWQIYFLVPIIILFTYFMYKENHNNLQWYATITNTYYNAFFEELPRQPNQYKGVIFYINKADVRDMNEFIAKSDKVMKGNNIGSLDILLAVFPYAKEAGFKIVDHCDDERNIKYDNTLDYICKLASEDKKKQHFSKHNSNIYNIIGEYDGVLVLSINKEIIE
jgi:hypothetical protein